MKCDVYALITLRGALEEVVHKGRFKWDRQTTEKQALMTVMRQFTRKELQRLKSITFDPISEPHLPWLVKSKTFDFLQSQIISTEDGN